MVANESNPSRAKSARQSKTSASSASAASSSSPLINTQSSARKSIADEDTDDDEGPASIPKSARERPQKFSKHRSTSKVIDDGDDVDEDVVAPFQQCSAHVVSQISAAKQKGQDNKQMLKDEEMARQLDASWSHEAGGSGGGRGKSSRPRHSAKRARSKGDTSHYRDDSDTSEANANEDEDEDEDDDEDEEETDDDDDFADDDEEAPKSKKRVRSKPKSAAAKKDGSGGKAPRNVAAHPPPAKRARAGKLGPAARNGDAMPRISEEDEQQAGNRRSQKLKSSSPMTFAGSSLPGGDRVEMLVAAAIAQAPHNASAASASARAPAASKIGATIVIPDSDDEDR